MASRKALIVVANLASVFTLLHAQNAVAIPDFNFYTYSSCPACANNRIDPVNIMFFNYGLYPRVTDQVSYHSNSAFYARSNSWPAYNPQAFKDHQLCFNPDTATIIHIVNAEPIGNRFHFRLHEVAGYDNSWGWTSVADAHCDHFTACHGWAPSHRVPYGGFNSGRDAYVSILHLVGNNGHGIADGYYGNTDLRPQCNGDLPRSDGWLLAARIHSQNH